MLVLTTGCRGRAQKEVYDAQMAHEIRVLEDQLYEADYQNRVLIDKIESLKLRGAPPFQRTDQDTRLGNPSLPDPIRDPSLQTRPSFPQSPNDPLLDSIDDLDSIIDNGMEEPLKPAPPSIENLNLPPPNNGSEAPSDSPQSGNPPNKSPREDKRLGYLPKAPTSSNPSTIGQTRDKTSLEPAPGGPEPPGKSSLIAPPIIPGNLLPPPGKEPAELLPPGQITLPDSASISVPKNIRLHRSLSGGVKRSGAPDQIMLVVNVLDQRGRPIELADYEVRAALSVVLFDGDEEPNDSTRLGRWDFDPDEVNLLIKEDPISGFHIPINWKGVHPASDVVQAHVRLRAEGDEMRCSEVVNVQPKNAMTKWAPRGDPMVSTPTR